MTQWDLFDNVLKPDSIPDTQPSGRHPVTSSHGTASQPAIAFAIAAVFTFAIQTVIRESWGGTSAPTVVIDRAPANLKRESSALIRAQAAKNPDAPDFKVGKTSKQLAESFRALLRPIPPEDDIHSDFSFG